MKEKEFELKGKAKFYATDIGDAFKKLSEYFANLARHCEDETFDYEDDIFEPGTDIRIEPIKKEETNDN